MSLSIPVTLLAAHFLGDFLLQSDRMALGKSKSLRWLLFHTLVYSACFLPWGWRFVLVTFVLHTLTDFCTSRVTSRLWFISFGDVVTSNESGMKFSWAYLTSWKRHWFFSMIGLDQLIHYVTLALTLRWVS